MEPILQISRRHTSKDVNLHIDDVPTTLGHLQECLLHNLTKENFHKHIPEDERFVSLTERLH
jgi:hypothetical protein